MMDNRVLYKLIKNINESIYIAICHGGDFGGAYYSDFDMLFSTLCDLAEKLTSISESYVVCRIAYDAEMKKDGIEYRLSKKYELEKPRYAFLVGVNP